MVFACILCPATTGPVAVAVVGQSFFAGTKKPARGTRQSVAPLRVFLLVNNVAETLLGSVFLSSEILHKNLLFARRANTTQMSGVTTSDNKQYVALGGYISTGRHVLFIFPIFAIQAGSFLATLVHERQYRSGVVAAVVYNVIITRLVFAHAAFDSGVSFDCVSQSRSERIRP